MRKELSCRQHLALRDRAIHLFVAFYLFNALNDGQVETHLGVNHLSLTQRQFGSSLLLSPIKLLSNG